MTTLKLNTYTPDFSKKRVIDRTIKVLDWCDITLTSRIQIHSKELRLVFGTQSNSLSAYLRANLLSTNGKYTTGAESKSYELNKIGYDKLRLLTKSEKQSSKHIAKCILEKTIHPDVAELKFTYSDKKHRLNHPLQHMKRELKTEFWADKLPHNYDIEAAAPTLLLQKAYSNGFKKILAEPIEHYLKNKQEVREYIANLVNISVKDAKKIINSLFAGGRMSANIKCAAFHTLDQNKESMAILVNDPLFRRIRLAIKHMWNSFGQKVNKIYKGRGLKLTRQQIGIKFKTPSEKWDLYFSLEREVLNAMINFLDERQIKFFAEHDGFRSAREINIDEMTDYIFSQTTYRVKLEKETVDINTPPLTTSLLFTTSEPEKKQVLNSSIRTCTNAHRTRQLTPIYI